MDTSKPFSAADPQVAALLRFNTGLLEITAVAMIDLIKDRGGTVPPETLAFIHEKLPRLSELAIAVPESVSALNIFDKLVAMFPPPARPD